MSSTDISGATQDSPQDKPESLGRYRLGQRIGRGGTSLIYAADYIGPLGFQLQVAVKVAKPGFGKRLLDEARLLSQISHPQIVSVFDIGEESGTYYYAMERIEGVSLREVIRRAKRIPLHVCLDLTLQLCDALQRLHYHYDGTQSAIFHGDLKPSNIMIQPDGRLKLIDFGVAAPFGLAQKPKSYGTPAYMAPEQVMRGILDGQTDIFSMGVILFELLTGDRLFPGEDIARLVRERMEVDRILDPFHIAALVGARSPALPSVIHQCLRGKRMHRYPSIGAVRNDLQEIVRMLPRRLTTANWWNSRGANCFA